MCPNSNFKTPTLGVDTFSEWFFFIIKFFANSKKVFHNCCMTFFGLILFFISRASKKDWKSNELFKMWSPFFVSLKLTEILNIWTVLLIFNYLESGQISKYLRQLKVKNVRRPHLGNTETLFLVLNVLIVILHNNVYKIIPQIEFCNHMFVVR